MDTQVKTAVEGLGKAFEEYKATHQEELKQIKAKGSADVVTSDKLKRIEKTLDTLEDVNQKVTKQKLAQEQQQDQLNKIETKLLTKTKLFDEVAVAINVIFLEVSKKRFPLAYQKQ